MENNFIVFEREIINISHIVRMWMTFNVYGFRSEYNLLVIGGDVPIKSDDPGEEFVRFYKNCVNRKSVNYEMEKKLDILRDKVAELEDMIKYLPIVSEEYNSAKTHFTSNQ
jgi:hypothetical protein